MEESPNTIFVVSEYQGNIAIFKKNNPSPLKVTDVQIIDLPSQDRELLKAVQKRIEELIEAKKQHVPRAKLQEKVNQFKDFISKTLMPIKSGDYYQGQYY